jgi:hypothetical protein
MSKFGFGFGAPVMGPLAGFGANNGRVPKYTPGAVQSSPMAELYRNQNPDEEYMRMMQMLDSQSRGQNRPPAAMHAQPGPMPPQAPAPEQPMPDQPIKAPSDRGMFGRFLGGLGKVAGKAGEFAMFGPVGMQIRADHRRREERAEQKAAEEEARRQQAIEQYYATANVPPEMRAYAQAFPDQAAEMLGGLLTPAAAPEYGLDLIPVQDANGNITYVQSSKAGGVRPVEGYVPPPSEPATYASQMDALGVRRYTEGPDIGQPVPGFETPRPREAITPGRKTEKDQNGVLRYIDTGEPVFPDVETAPAAAKPLIGAESMGRVAAGLPNMRQAVKDLKSALGVNIQDGIATTVKGGYRPDQDWGALVLDNIPFTGDVLARVAGGEDYQKFDNAYSTFEAAALPIMSGAAVTDSEAKRALKALRVRVGDTDEAVARKMANMERMVAGLEAAAAGDTVTLQAIVSGINLTKTAVGGDDLPPGFVILE